MNRFLAGALASVVCLSACRSSEDADRAAETQASNLGGPTTLFDQVTPAEVASEHARRLRPLLQEAIAQHPEITQLLRSNLGVFAPDAANADLRDALEDILAQDGEPLPVASLDARLEPSLTKRLSELNGGQTVYPCYGTGDADRERYRFACYRASEGKAIRLAKAPSGVDFKEVFAKWRAIPQPSGGSLGHRLPALRTAGTAPPRQTDVAENVEAFFDGAFDDGGLAKTLATAPGVRKVEYTVSRVEDLDLEGDPSGSSYVSGTGHPHNDIVTAEITIYDEHNQVWGFSVEYDLYMGHD